MTTMERMDETVDTTAVEYTTLQEVAVKNGPHRLLCLESPDLGAPGLGNWMVENVIQKHAHEKNKPLVVYIQGTEYNLLAGVAQAMRVAKEAGRLGEHAQVAEAWPELVDGKVNQAYGPRSDDLINEPGLLMEGVTVTEASTGRAANRMYRHFQTKFQASSLVGVAAFEEHGSDNKIPTTYVIALSQAPANNEQYAYFTDAPRREQAAILNALVSNTQADTANTPPWQPGNTQNVWRGPTANLNNRG